MKRLRYCFGLDALPGAVCAGHELTVLVDNEWVKVSRMKDLPADKRGAHSHKDTLVLALTDSSAAGGGEGEGRRY